METQGTRVGIFMKVYRNEPTMHRAVKSILEQTYKNIKFYILTSSATKSIMMEYAKQDERIEVLEGKAKDSFVTIAKNIAFENSYVAVLDADDWCEDTYIEAMLQEAEVRNVEIVACGNYFISEDQKRVAVRTEKSFEWTRNQTNQVLWRIYGHFRTLWGKLIKSEVITACDFGKLPEEESYGVYGGDTMTAFLMLSHAQKSCICDKILYNYQDSKVGESYEIRKGRLDADEILYKFTENLLNNIGGYGEQQRWVLLMVYKNALKDTISVIINAKSSEKERVERIEYVLNKDLSRSVIVMESTGKLNISASQEKIAYITDIYHPLMNQAMNVMQEENVLCKYKELLEMICPKIKGILSNNEFKLLLSHKSLLDAFVLENYQTLMEMLVVLYKAFDAEGKKVCQKLLLRLTKNRALMILLEDSEVILNYVEIIRTLIREDDENALNMTKMILSGTELPKEAEKLVDFWITLAAVLEREEEFILAKQAKVEILWILNKKREAKKEYDELCCLGIDDDNMVYLKENILGK